MTVAEVKARVPDLRLRAADRFNFNDYYTSVRADRYLSQAPLLKGVEAISFEFVDDRSYTVCRDSILMAGLSRFTSGRLPVVHVRDLVAQAPLNRRRQEAADRQREAEGNRRRSFKP